MPYEFKLPDLGEGVREGEVVEWLVAVDQEVAEDDPMLEVETDKATVAIPCPVDGKVSELHAQVGDTVTVGSPLITIATADDGGATAPPPAEQKAPAAVQAETARPARDASTSLSSGGSVRATPGARRAAQELGVDLAALTGSGPGGAVTERDVRSAPASSPAGTAPSLAGRREPIRGVRRTIGERLTQSHQEVPKVTVVEECDFTWLTENRNGMSYVPFVVKAVTAALEEFPDFNATIDGDEIVYLDDRNIGVAAQGPKGLIVPVLRETEEKSLADLDAEVGRLAEEVRNETIAPEKLRGGTFTVTLAGKLGGFFATPLVNLGEAAILGVHRIKARPMVVDDEITIRQIGLVSCSFDHRITDGTRASMFLLRVIGELEGGNDAG